MLQKRYKVAYCGRRWEWWRVTAVILSLHSIRTTVGYGKDFERIAKGPADLLVIDRSQGDRNIEWVVRLIADFKGRGFKVITVGTNFPDQEELFQRAGAIKALRGYPEPEIFLRVVEDIFFGR